MIIKRDILSKIEQFINDKEIIALVGLRQVGKTTLLKEIQKVVENSNKITKYITFEDIKILNLFEEDIDQFIKEFVEPNDCLFIDEIQYSQNSGKRLKYIYDTKEIKMFISGSSKSDLALHSLSRLVGRVLVFDILPLSFKEFVRFKNKEDIRLLEGEQSEFRFKSLKIYFEEYLQFGGYPEIVLENDVENKKVKLNNIYNTYLLKEISEILNYKNIFDFEKVLRRLALNDGGILNKSNIAMDTEINRNKIDEVLSTLEKTGVIQIVYPFFKNKTKQMIKSPKIYFTDLGFKNTIINNFNTLDYKQDKGSIYKNFVLNCLIHNKYRVEFYRIDESQEVDFIIEKNGELIGIEIKSKLKNDTVPKSTQKFINIYKPNKMYILNENIYSKKENVIFSNYLEEI